MGAVKGIFDSLANLMTGQGTSVDRRMHTQFVQPFVDPSQIEAAYRGSWLVRRIVDTPAFDMTRAWRDWQGQDKQIEDLEAEERRLHVREKIQAGLRLGRLGGGAIILGLADRQPGEPLPEDMGIGDLLYLHPVSKVAITVGPMVDDPVDADFGEPAWYELKRSNGELPVRLHRDRVIVFKGLYASGSMNDTVGRSEFWGDSVVLAVGEAVKNAETAMGEFASLISEAKVDVFKIPDLMAQAGTPEYEKRFMRRMELAQMSKSTHRAVIMDAAEDWEQRQLNLGGMAEIMLTYLSVCAGAADMPATRLLGKAPDGMNATGAGDQSNYDQMIRSRQDGDLRPALDKLDRALVPSALGSTPDELYYEFAALSVPSEAQAAETEGKEATTLAALVNTGLFEDEALEEAFSNRMIESGRWPGYEKARKKALAAAEKDPDPVDVPGLGITQPPPAGPPPANAPNPGAPVPPPTPPAPPTRA